MSNLSWFTTDHPLDRDAIEASLRKHTQARFGELVVVTRESPHYWNVDVPAALSMVSVALASQRKVTLNPGGMLWSDYLEWFVCDHLAAEFGGTCGGEFDDDAHWQPDPSKYSTFESFLRRRVIIAHRDLDDGERAYIQSLPEVLR